MADAPLPVEQSPPVVQAGRPGTRTAPPAGREGADADGAARRRRLDAEARAWEKRQERQSWGWVLLGTALFLTFMRLDQGTGESWIYMIVGAVVIGLWCAVRYAMGLLDGGPELQAELRQDTREEVDPTARGRELSTSVANFGVLRSVAAFFAILVLHLAAGYFWPLDTLSCSDFDSQRDAQAAFEEDGGPMRDPHHLDADDDGVACERL